PERTVELEIGGRRYRRHQPLQRGPEERCGRRLLEPLLKWARPNKAEPTNEDRSKRREAQRLADEEGLDHGEHQPERGTHALARVVARLRSQFVDHFRRERSLQLPLYRLRFAFRLS